MHGSFALTLVSSGGGGGGGGGLTYTESGIQSINSKKNTILLTCPLHITSGCGKRDAHSIWSMVTCKGSITRYWNYLEDYSPCAGGFSAVDAIGTQLRDPINSGSDPMAYGSMNKWTPPRKSGGIPKVSNRFSLNVENEQADA